jgi:cation diffusion facilitator CzcD-associated flavoprotein CzcO
MAEEHQQRWTGIRSVAVIGAGVSGILATRYLAEAGLDVTVFERNNKAGGVWSVTSYRKQRFRPVD